MIHRQPSKSLSAFNATPCKQILFPEGEQEFRKQGDLLFKRRNKMDFIYSTKNKKTKTISSFAFRFKSQLSYEPNTLKMSSSNLHHKTGENVHMCFQETNSLDSIQ